MMGIEQLEATIRRAMEAGRWDTAEHFGRQLDEAVAAQAKPAPSLAGAALWYAGAGLPVFPVWAAGTRDAEGQPSDKRPMVRSGCHAATTNLDRVRAWWQQWPRANIGLATGHVVDVIDLDGPDGLWAWMEAQHNPPAVGVVRTPRPGGWHVYIPVTGRGNAARIGGRALDYRGQGGYVLAPPSAIDTPGYAGAYRWHRPLDLTRPRPWPQATEELEHNQGEQQ